MVPTGQSTHKKRPAQNPDMVRDAARTLFAEYGYQGTALSQIASELGIQTPSLYNHMTSKQALLQEIILETSEKVWSDFERAEAGGGSLTDRLGRSVAVYARHHATHRRDALIVNRDVRHLDEPVLTQVLALRRQHERAIRGLIEEGLGIGEFTVEDSRLSSFAILEMCVSIARWFHEEGPLSPDETATIHAQFALRLVGADQPQ